MIFWRFVNLYKTSYSHSAAPPYAPPDGRYVAGKIGHTRKWAKMGSEICPPPGGLGGLVCLVGAHTVPRSGR